MSFTFHTFLDLGRNPLHISDWFPLRVFQENIQSLQREFILSVTICWKRNLIRLNAAIIRMKEICQSGRWDDRNTRPHVTDMYQSLMTLVSVKLTCYVVDLQKCWVVLIIEFSVYTTQSTDLANICSHVKFTEPGIGLNILKIALLFAIWVGH